MTDAQPHSRGAAGSAATHAPARVPRRWERLGHVLTELDPNLFEVRDKGGRELGWVSRMGARFQAHGHAREFSASPVLGTFRSGQAALRLVIGHYDLMAKRAAILAEVRQIEQAHERQRPHGT